MCTISMIFDHYNPIIPLTVTPIGPSTAPLYDVEAMRKLIEEFHAAMAAAKLVDKTLGTPDCEDSEKAKLLERVAELEKTLENNVYILKYLNYYLDPDLLFTSEQKEAKRFASKVLAEQAAWILRYDWRIVKLVKKSS